MEFGMGMGMAPAPAPAYGTSDCVPAYLYGLPSADTLRIDDLLDFSNQDVYASAAVTDRHHIPHHSSNCYPHLSSSFADDIYIPSEEAAELEWLSNFVEDSFSYVPYPAASIPHATALTTAQSSSSSSTSSSSSSDFPTPRKRNVAGVDSVVIGVEESGVRRCTHCASEKTPQWRTGPLGPKTLCNACGVRYKSGRLVPEYRPAASPTFVLTQHSNSHRKVMELRRQKEVHHQRQPNESVIYQDRLVSLS